MNDIINHPHHYTFGDIECIEAIRAQLTYDEYIGFLRGSIAKYNWRLTQKGSPKQNADKLLWYAIKLSEVLSVEDDDDLLD